MATHRLTICIDYDDANFVHPTQHELLGRIALNSAARMVEAVSSLKPLNVDFCIDVIKDDDGVDIDDWTPEVEA